MASSINNNNNDDDDNDYDGTNNNPFCCRPHLFYYSDLLDKKPADCCEHAFSIAEQFLDVDRLLDPAGKW